MSRSPTQALRFTKMHGLGNDFIVLEPPAAFRWPAASEWRALADRHTGIGFDQALVIVPASSSGATAGYRIFNADGGEVEQCGNGARCVAKWLRLQGRVSGEVLTLESIGGLIEARFGAADEVSVNMGEPRFQSGGESWLDIDSSRIQFTAVSIGNPHIVLLVDAVTHAPVATLGATLECHPAFPGRTNVGFLQIDARDHGRLRVFERGVGETLACGTGACAAMAVGRRAGRFDERVTLELPGGALQVDWRGAGHPLWLTGPADVAYRGELDWN